MSFGPLKSGKGAVRAAPYEGDPSEDSWTCPNCSNLNYGHREVCNTRTCRHPKPTLVAPAAGQDPTEDWTCLHCNNVNYARRDICNTKKCRAPRWQGDSILASHPPGAWRCVCGNVNYANRTHCNTKKCMMPSPKFVGYGPPMAVMAPQMPLMARPSMILTPTFGKKGAGKAPRISDSADAPEGSWACVKCGNVNYAHREVCNTKLCRAPRPSIEPDSAAEWTCMQCGNRNYGFRVVCNTRKCGAPKH